MSSGFGRLVLVAQLSYGRWPLNNLEWTLLPFKARHPSNSIQSGAPAKIPDELSAAIAAFG
jgi:hypothetical protein